MLTYHTAIIGAGASGLFCAGSFNQPKIILDHNAKPGVRVGVSGGGKCNFSNRYITAADYQSQAPHFCKSALAAFEPQDFTRLLDNAQIPYEERADGQLFARNAQDMVNFLARRAQAAHTDFSLNTEVLDIQTLEDTFLIRTSKGTIQASQVVLACGGLSYPALGASSLGNKLARKFGLPVIEQRPALCGLTLPKQGRARCKALAGNSTVAEVKTGRHTFTGPLLFTHEGISGPPVLSISLFWQEGTPVHVNFLPTTNVLTLLQQHKTENKRISSCLPLTGKIAQTLLGSLDQPLANISKNTLLQAVQQISSFSFVPTGTSGYNKAEVTSGGIDTRTICANTFEVKTIPGLYIIGEVLDVTGRLGGFNLHWAWSSAWCAAQNLALKF